MKKKGMLVVAIILMSIGFAAVSTTLIINGNAKVNENTDDYSVIFTKATLDGIDVYNEVTSQDKKTITFRSKDLKKLNDTSVLTYEVTNNSSNYDAEVKINCGLKNGTEAKYTSIKNELENNATIVKAKESVNGTLTITLNQTSTEEITEEYTCTLEFNAVERDTIGEVQPIAFATDAWETIQKAVQTGNTSMYNVGDAREINLGDLGTHTVRIANKSECTNGETSETACGFVVEFVDIVTTQPFNSTTTNVGGWRDSAMRTYVNGTIYESLPSDLQDVIVSTKVISGHGSTSGETNFETQDKLYLLSGHEVYEDGASDKISTNDTSYNNTKQLDYYKSQGVTTSNSAGAEKQYNGSDYFWWLRSPDSSAANTFLCAFSSGWGVSFVDGTGGVSPAFRIA